MQFRKFLLSFTLIAGILSFVYADDTQQCEEDLKSANNGNSTEWGSIEGNNRFLRFINHTLNERADSCKGHFGKDVQKAELMQKFYTFEVNQIQAGFQKLEQSDSGDKPCAAGSEIEADYNTWKTIGIAFICGTGVFAIAFFVMLGIFIYNYNHNFSATL